MFTPKRIESFDYPVWPRFGLLGSRLRKSAYHTAGHARYDHAGLRTRFSDQIFMLFAATSRQDASRLRESARTKLRNSARVFFSGR